MKNVLSTPYVSVTDDFLPEPEWIALWTHFQQQEFSFLNGGRWSKNYRFLDGRPLMGSGVYSEEVVGLTETRQVVSQGSLPYMLADQLQVAAANNEDLLGKKDLAWVMFSITPFVYPPGTSLSWHDDYTLNAGSYIYYVHPEWNAHWGGELLVSEIRDMPRPMVERNGKREILGPFFDSSDEGARIVASGVGHYVMPKPNRLVVIGGGVQHCIKRVEPAAGDRARCSFAGFFIDPSKEEQREALELPFSGGRV